MASRLPRALALVATIAVALSGFLVGSTSPATAAGQHGVPDGGNLNVRLANHGGQVRVSWDAAPRGGEVTYYVLTSADRATTVDVKRFGPYSATSATVPHTASATPASGAFTFVTVEVHRNGARRGGTLTKWLMPTPVTPPRGGPTVHLATFNVMVWSIQKHGRYTAWKNRRGRVARQIKSSGADIIMLQEVSGPPKHVRTKGRLYQYEDLAKRVGKKLRLTDKRLYRKRKRPVGSQGSRILYDRTRYAKLSTGRIRLPGEPLRKTRWAPWALLRDRSTGAELYALSTHFRTGKGADDWHVRQRQADAVLRKTRHWAGSGRSVYVGGDFNSSSLQRPTNNVPRTLVAGGFYDAFATASSVGTAYPTANRTTFPVKMSPWRIDYLMSYNAPQGSYSYRNHVYHSLSSFQSNHFLQSAVMPVKAGPYGARRR